MSFMRTQWTSFSFYFGSLTSFLFLSPGGTLGRSTDVRARHFFFQVQTHNKKQSRDPSALVFWPKWWRVSTSFVEVVYIHSSVCLSVCTSHSQPAVGGKHVTPPFLLGEIHWQMRQGTNAPTPFACVPVSYLLSHEASLSLQLTEIRSSLKGGGRGWKEGRRATKKVSVVYVVILKHPGVLTVLISLSPSTEWVVLQGHTNLVTHIIVIIINSYEESSHYNNVVQLTSVSWVKIPSLPPVFHFICMVCLLHTIQPHTWSFTDSAH